MGEGEYHVQWFDPRKGGALQDGGLVSGPGETEVGPPPSAPEKDWILVLKR